MNEHTQKSESQPQEVESTLREDLQLIEYRNAEYVVPFYDEEVAETLDAIVSEIESISPGENMDRFLELQDMIDALPVRQKIKLKFDILDGTGQIRPDSKEVFTEDVIFKMHALFGHEQNFKELEKLALFKKSHPNVRIKMVIAHGGAEAEWDPVLPVIAKQTWMYWDVNKQAHPLKELIETINKEADVLLLICCNEANITMKQSPITVFYSHGKVSTTGSQEMKIIAGSEGEYQESVDTE
jgi:hypothetical protein